MEIDLRFFGSFCSTEKFEINGIDGDSDDFGEQSDFDHDGAQEYGCGDMRFTRKEPSPLVLLRYKITEDEYLSICDRLEDGLSFGCCGWCV